MSGDRIREKTSIVQLLSTRYDTARPGTFRGGIASSSWHLSFCSSVALLFYLHAWLEMEVAHQHHHGIVNASESYTKKVLTVSQKLLYPLKQNTIENIVLSCDKIAYLDFASKIMDFKIPTAMINFLVKHPLVLGKEKLFVSDIGVSIVHDSGLLEFLRNVYESGIFRWVEGRINSLRESRSGVKSWLRVPRGAQQLQFSSNFSQTFFSIYNILSCICLGIFVVEMSISRIYVR
ncbi:unnamed protein product [Allacma fusca]|uniref:Uncharacterized protein n=1 Tax=Allacma fusca TaxID=39272 RepID=A0A8J2JGX0_9HEXA|nr:unnamed protein product [Allacma fusca]